MKLKAAHSNVIIRRIETELQSAGGIVLTEGEQEHRGTVLAVGPGRTLTNGKILPLDVKVGDVVVFSPYAGNTEIPWEGEDLIIIKEDEIFAVIEE